MDDDQNEILNHRHKRLVNILSLSQQFQQFMEEEFNEVCERLARIGTESMKSYSTPFEVTTPKEFISNIITMNINNPGFLSDDLKVFFLKILTRMITEKNVRNREQALPADQWTIEYWQDYKEEITKAQDLLNECGAAELIFQTFREPQLETRLNLAMECLGFFIAFLLGGNTKSQNSFLQRLKSDANNTVLNNFAIIIRKISMVIQNNFQIRYQKEKENSLYVVQTMDNYDHLDPITMMVRRYNVNEPDNAKETAYKK